MKDISRHQATIEECGYEVVGQFALPESSWWENFYSPLAQRLEMYEMPWDDEEARAVLSMVQGEIDIYRRYSSCYGYVFFLLRRRS